jgi:hypothetical protein
MRSSSGDSHEFAIVGPSGNTDRQGKMCALAKPAIHIGGVTVARYHLAQANIGRFRGPIESDIMEGFRVQLDPINAIADQSPGFIWRLQTEDGNATAIRPYSGDDLMAINMSVWESLESLQHFVYKSGHVDSLRARKQWFEPLEGPILVMWWIPAGEIPAVTEAQARLAHLKEHGPSPYAFTFRTPFPAPDDANETEGLDAVFCDWATPDSPPQGT